MQLDQNLATSIVSGKLSFCMHDDAAGCCVYSHASVLLLKSPACSNWQAPMEDPVSSPCNLARMVMQCHAKDQLHDTERF